MAKLVPFLHWGRSDGDWRAKGRAACRRRQQLPALCADGRTRNTASIGTRPAVPEPEEEAPSPNPAKIPFGRETGFRPFCEKSLQTPLKPRGKRGVFGGCRLRWCLSTCLTYRVFPSPSSTCCLRRCPACILAWCSGVSGRSGIIGVGNGPGFQSFTQVQCQHLFFRSSYSRQNPIDTKPPFGPITKSAGES